MSKRQDVADRFKNKKGKREKVVKCSLQNRLIEKSLLPEIEKWVLTVSKITNKGSLVFNRLLLHCLNNGIELPNLSDLTLYLQCLNIGSGVILKRNPPLEEVWNNYFTEYPSIPKIKGDIQAYTYAAKTYQTNFINSLKFTFEKRQKYFIRKWCEVNKIDSSNIYPIICEVNKRNYISKGELSEKVKDFIEIQKETLGNEEEITTEWIGSHKENVVSYFWVILNYIQQFEDVRKFTLAPISNIKRHFISIDTKVLFRMLQNIKLFEGNLKTFQSLRNEHFNTIFNLKGLSTGEFSYMIETDSVSACFHFHVPEKKVSPCSNQTKQRSRVIAIDPGRVNLVYGVEKTNTGIKTYSLTRREYYNSSGMNASNNITSKWEKDIEEAEKIFRQQSIKTVDENIWDQFLADYISVYDILWEGKTGKKWARNNFRTYCLKRKTLDNFFQKMKGNTKPVIAYGAAKFNSTSRGELSAPTTYVSKRCAKHYPTVMVDEFRTTKMCYKCRKPLQPTFRYIEDQLREVRGLRWCRSTNCCTFLNRDLNAALNILRCFKSGNKNIRPKYLSRKPFVTDEDSFKCKTTEKRVRGKIIGKTR